MARERPALFAWNRGEVSTLALARVDVDRIRLSAETQVNYMPWVLGPMMLRPGSEYLGGTRNNAVARNVPFVFSNSDVALLEFSDSTLRVRVSETLISRAAVATTVTSGDFSASSGWTRTTSGAGATATITGGLLTMASPTAGGYARCEQTLTVASGDQNKEHALTIVVTHGPMSFQIGSTSGGDDYVAQTSLDTGTHSIAFTPTGSSVYLRIETTTGQQKIVDSVQIASASTLELPTPYAAADIPYIRFTQSGDIVYLACDGYQQRKIERRSLTSWSISLYHCDDGPFANPNATDTTFAPASLSGNTTISASRNTFRSSMVGMLIRLFSAGQMTNDGIASANTFGSTIRVSGASTDRTFSYTISGVWSGTVSMQRSIDSATSGFTTVTTFTSNANTTYNDSLTNIVAWYRFGFEAGNYTSGTATMAMTYAGGGASGIARITGYNSPTSVAVEVLSAFSSLTGTTNWNLGDWGDYPGWPSSVAFHDGRLWWSGRDKIWGSVSDAYTSFDYDSTGDAATINRSVGFGPVDTINWILPLTRLIVGREGSEVSIRSSSFDEPLTPTNFTIKDCSTQGSTSIQAQKIDTRGVFVQRSNRRVYELAFNSQIADYQPHDLTRLNPDIGLVGFSGSAVQRQPDTQVHFIRTDGQDAVLLHAAEDEVEAWWRIVTDGAIEDVCVLPGQIEDKVYFIVARTVGGQTVRYVERLARRDQCSGLPEARCADAHVMYSGAPTTTITGLSHLEGRSVVVWGWNTSTPFTVTLPDGSTQIVGKALGTYTVSGGQITGLTSSVTNACVGLSYTARFKSTKLAYAAQGGTALLQKKQITQIGLILHNTHAQSITFGQDFSVMDPMPGVEDGWDVDPDTIWASYDNQMFPLPGVWDTDARLCLQSVAPKPCTILAAVIPIQTNE